MPCDENVTEAPSSQRDSFRQSGHKSFALLLFLALLLKASSPKVLMKISQVFALGTLLALTLITPFDAMAAARAKSAPAMVASASEPATLGFGVGYYDVLDNSPRKEAVDFRLEYRSAFDMLSLANASNSVVDIRPFGGIETTTDGALYGLGGFVADMVFWDHWVVSPNIGVGLYYRGDGKRLGSFVEFRSTFETGYQFDNGTRLTAALGHISNAHLTSINHGVEIANVYLHLPVDTLFGR